MNRAELELHPAADFETGLTGFNKPNLMYLGADWLLIFPPTSYTLFRSSSDIPCCKSAITITNFFHFSSILTLGSFLTYIMYTV